MTADGRLALVDVDGTLTPVRSIWQHLLEAIGRWDPEGSRHLDHFLAGEIDYDEFCRRDALLFAGVPYASLQAIAGDVPLHPGSLDLLRGLRDRGFRVALVSTGLRVLTDRLERLATVDACVANDLEAIAGICSGRAVVEVHEHDKGKHAAHLIERFRSTFTIAVGDGSADVPMFERADLGIAVGEASLSAREAAHAVVPTWDADALLAMIDAATGDRWSA